MRKGYVQYIILFVFTVAICSLYNNCTGQSSFASFGSIKSRSLNVSQDEIIYEQPSFDRIDGHYFDYLEGTIFDASKISVNQMGSTSTTEIPQWNVGDYTGVVVPSLERSRFERVTNAADPSTALQLYGNEAGMLVFPSESPELNSVDQPAVLSQDWQDSDDIHPWDDPTKALVFTSEIQVPTIANPGSATATATGVLKFKDVTSGAQFSFSNVFFDTRRNYFGESVTMNENSDGTAFGVVMSLYRDHAKYNTTIEGNFGSDPWGGYENYSYAITQDNIKSIISDLKTYLKDNEMQDDFSDNPADYILIQYNVSAQIHYPDYQKALPDRQGTPTYLGMSVKNIKILKTVSQRTVPDCSDSWQGLGVFWCDGKSEHQRVCGCRPQGYNDPDVWLDEGNECYSRLSGDPCSKASTPACSSTAGVFWCDNKQEHQRVCGCRPDGYQDSDIWTDLGGDCYTRETGKACE